MPKQLAPARRYDFSLLMIGGIALMGCALFDDHDWPSDLRFVGGILLLGGLIRWAVRPLFISVRDLYTAGVQQGHETGYQEGRRAHLQMVVPLTLLEDYKAEKAEREANQS